MSESHIFEGKTSTEAIENGLKELGVSKSKVDIKILEQEDKRSFFNILTPRVVKVEMKLKDNVSDDSKDNTERVKNVNKSKENVSEEDIKKSMDAVKKFLDDFISSINKNLKYELKEEDGIIKVNIDGDDTGYLIGYRGEVLNSIQNIISNVACKSFSEKIRVSVNISGYREKREKDLGVLATKIANTVIKKGKDITLEPMQAYERKIIHTKLQDNDKIKTYSIGEEPYRKVVVSLKK